MPHLPRCRPAGLIGVGATMAKPAQDKVKVLFFAANPEGTGQLALGEEAREVDAKIRAAKHRDSLELVTRWAVQTNDLLQSLNQEEPAVVHFSGHGSKAEQIILQDNNR